MLKVPATNCRFRALAVLLALPALAALAPPAIAQTTAAQGVAPRRDSVIVYRREVFRYAPAGRPDPFRSLLGSSEVGVRVEDLALRGVVYHTDPSRSVAVLSRTGVERPVRARVGDRIGAIRILAIRPRSIDILVEEFGIPRRETLEITRTPAAKGDS